MSEHARLAPSAAARWLRCPGSVRLSELVPGLDAGPWAEEGTRAHTLAADLLTGASAGPPEDEDPAERAQMEHDLMLYVDVVNQLLVETGGSLLVEQRFDTGIAGCWGTADAVITSHDRLVVVDLKYGAGVPVDAAGNPQLRLYALGAYRTFCDFLDIQRIDTLVVQPRVSGGHVSSERLTPDELRAWAFGIEQQVAAVDSAVAVFAPSAAACRWCPAAGRCRALASRVYSAEDPADVVMTERDLAEALETAQLAKIFIDRTTRAALKYAYDEGGEIPGWKVVAGTSRREVTDESAALAALTAAGFPKEQVSRDKLLPITMLDRVLGKEGKHILAPFINRRTSGPVVVPETDRRRSVSPNTNAKLDFADIKEAK